MVAAAERARARSGRTTDVTLTAAQGEVDLAGTQVVALLYQGRLPGKEIRLGKGDLLNVAFANDIDQAGSVHWHGIALRNDMDGVPGLTQDPVPARGRFDYSFTVPDPGTYWFHPHSGLQLDNGLYAPLIVEDPAEALADVEAVLVLDDWMLGFGRTPEGSTRTSRRTAWLAWAAWLACTARRRRPSRSGRTEGTSRTPCTW